jgi:hypothetical protein
MSKFIACADGSYVNINQIISFHILSLPAVREREEQEFYAVRFDTIEKSYLLISQLSEKDVQSWLDKFMLKYDLVIDVKE